MNTGCFARTIAGVAVTLSLVGCGNAPGKPRLEAVAPRPNQILDFPKLYQQNCAACHGAHGRQGAAISLANPTYLATAGIDNMRRTIVNGLPGTLMPAFAKPQGGLLTGAQIDVISKGMMQTWGSSSTRFSTLPYTSHTPADFAHGKIAYTTFCASCHGVSGAGAGRVGSIVDPAYLDLMSDEALRSTILAGRPDQGMPDWRSDDAARAMTDQEVTDTVAWIGSYRSPGQKPTGTRGSAENDE